MVPFAIVVVLFMSMGVMSVYNAGVVAGAIREKPESGERELILGPKMTERFRVWTAVNGWAGLVGGVAVGIGFTMALSLINWYWVSLGGMLVLGLLVGAGAMALVARWVA